MKFSTTLNAAAIVIASCGLADTSALAGTARVVSNNGDDRQASNAGFATASFSRGGRYASANSYEFLAGVGVSAFTGTSGGETNGYQNAQAAANAGVADAFYVGTNTPGLFDTGSGVFILSYSINASGGATANGNLITIPGYYPGVHSSATAGYNYNWNVGGQTGSGGVDRRNYEDGSSSYDVFGLGAAGQFGAQLFVRMGEGVNVTFAAAAFASADGLAPASAAADFGHTLRWGGVSSAQFLADGSSTPIDLPEGFELTLMSGTSGFDYMNAAGPNPFAAPGVPEPSTWALLILGFGMIGAGMRRRQRAALAFALTPQSHVC